MSGAKRGSCYRKSVTEEVTQSMPLPCSGELVVKVVGIRGGNQVEVVDDVTSNSSLALLPTKFKNLIWIKRGDYLIVSTSEDISAESKGLRYIIKHVLYKEQIRHIKSSNLWPASFNEEEKEAEEELLPDTDGVDSDNDDDIFVNNNKPTVPVDESDDDDSDDEAS